ncbi:MAG: FAD-dependent oxidoreductase [Alphaproteobacteria bacterium]|nr:FAD-dependent oxidoreductase [Alphaproteobacteria bacterium]
MTLDLLGLACALPPVLLGGGWLACWATRRGLDRRWLGLRGPFSRAVERRLGGWRHAVNQPDPTLPLRVEGSERPRVAIIGGGLGGLAAATLLADRGLQVELFEAHDYLGGKVGSWDQTLSTGETVGVEHGFHAFFHHYHNQWAWLTELGLTGAFTDIEDYEILRRDGGRLGFAATESVPVLNLVDLMRRGLYRASDIIGKPAMHEMDAFLRYDPVETPRSFDHMSFADFAERAALPPDLRLVFNTFSRAFFAEEDRMSMGELIKSFHFYYLSHDGGLLYAYPTDDYQRTLLEPIRARLAAAGAQLHLSTPVTGLERDGDRFVVRSARGDGGSDAAGFDAAVFDDVVIAADVVGARRILDGAGWLPAAAPALQRRLHVLRPGQRYAVLRLYLDRDLRPDVTAFAITDRVVLLDAIAVVHRLEDESRRYVDRHGGAVLELHSYAVPDAVGEGLDDAASDAAVRQQLLDELLHFFPELAGYRIRDEHLQVRRDFAAFHVGMQAARPGPVTEVPGLFLAGDWVGLPFPAMLMEAACSSGRLAANGVLTRHGLRETPIWSVPPRGLLADVPEPPKPPAVQAARDAAAQAWDAAVAALAPGPE